mmetsp:Transcript_2389/g.5050  ORF Transcript_2389/g.5050 Transcript_2389/m.5050 type:complete len:298 (-) Transcript_2389:891-1784(-)
MGCKDNHAAHAIHEVFQNGSCQTVAIKGGCSTAKLVNNDQRALGGRPQNCRRLEHFCHEGTDSSLLEIPSSDAGQNRVANVDRCRGARDVASDLCHANDGSQGSDVNTFTTHVRATHQQLCLWKGQINVVGNVFHVFLKFYARMAGSFQLDSGILFVAVRHGGFAIAKGTHGCRLRQGTKDIETSNGLCHSIDNARVGGRDAHGIPNNLSGQTSVIGLQVLVLCRQLPQREAGKVHSVLENAMRLDFFVPNLGRSCCRWYRAIGTATPCCPRHVPSAPAMPCWKRRSRHPGWPRARV